MIYIRFSKFEGQSTWKDVTAMEWLIPVGFAILVFVFCNGPQECIKLFTDAGVKKAEAIARAEEARTERAKLEHNKPLT